MNEIDIIIIVNSIGFLAILFFVYKWFKALLKTHGKMIALLLPIALIGFSAAVIGPNEDDVKEICKDEISKALDNPKKVETHPIKIVFFSHNASLLQKLHFFYEVESDSITKNYVLRKESVLTHTGITSNFEWTNTSTNMVKVNDSIYDFKINVDYRSKILYILSFSGNRKITKRVNIKSY
jgi:hypothetical protein